MSAFRCSSRNLEVRAAHNVILDARAFHPDAPVYAGWPAFRHHRNGRNVCVQCERLRTQRAVRRRRIVKKFANYVDPYYKPNPARQGKRFRRARGFRDCQYHGLRVKASIGLDKDGREHATCLRCHRDLAKNAIRVPVYAWAVDNKWSLPPGARRQSFVTLDQAGVPYFRRGVVVNGHGIARAMTGWELTHFLDAGPYYAFSGPVVHSANTLQDAIQLAQKGPS